MPRLRRNWLAIAFPIALVALGPAAVASFGHQPASPYAWSCCCF